MKTTMFQMVLALSPKSRVESCLIKFFNFNK